jgi:hypothetical protein
MPDMSPEARAFRQGFILGMKLNGIDRPDMTDWMVCVKEWRKYRAEMLHEKRN